MTLHTYGIEKTTIRLTVKLPDQTARIQRLYDYGAWFQIDEEVLTDVNKITDFINNITSQGGTMIDLNHFVDDDDLKEKFTYTFELVKYSHEKPQAYVIKAEGWYAVENDSIWGNHIEYEHVAKKYIYTTSDQIEKYITAVQEEMKKDPNWSAIYTHEPNDKTLPKVWAEEITIEGL